MDHKGLEGDNVASPGVTPQSPQPSGGVWLRMFMILIPIVACLGLGKWYSDLNVFVRMSEGEKETFAQVAMATAALVGVLEIMLYKRLKAAADAVAAGPSLGASSSSDK